MRFAFLSASATRSFHTGSDTEKAIDQPEDRRWWKCWELYPILLLAAFLRFYLIQTTEFDDDQANIFRLAHDAVSHGHLVATSNIASVKIYNPPGIIYLLMLPAAFSPNPLGGALLIALFSTLGVLLTYCLALRYYGRMTATIAALLYTTSALVIFYSRFMWQQNLLLFFAPLFIFVLFRGVVERKRGWFGPALFLLGLIIQLHGSGLLFALPLAVALLIAPRTVRWRDVALGVGLLLLIYAPYVLWEISTHFNDIQVLLHNTGGVSHIDTLALTFYQSFLSPLNDLELNPSSLLFPFAPLLNVIRVITTALAIAGIALALWQFLGIRAGGITATSTPFARLKQWWSTFTASPYRCGLAILLTWQLPVLTLLRHSIKLHAHYLILFMPGPYILVALFVTAVATWLRHRSLIWRGFNISLSGRIALSAIAILIIGAQTIGALSSVQDLGTGRFIDRQMSGIYYNDLRSLQNALSEADRIAQQRHLSRVYVNADDATISAFQSLAYQMHTPVTIINQSCTVLPDPAAGPVVMLVGPYSDLPTQLSPRFATLSQAAISSRLGGPPFRIYTASASTQAPPVRETLTPDLQWLGNQTLTSSTEPSLQTYWRALRSLPEQDGLLYSYNLIPSSGRTQPEPCTFTSLAKGDHLLMTLPLAADQPLTTGIKIQSFTTTSYTISFHLPLISLIFDTYKEQQSTPRTLVSPDGQEMISLTS